MILRMCLVRWTFGDFFTVRDLHPPTLFKKSGALFMILRMCLVRWTFGDFYFRYVPGVIPYFSLKILEK